VTTPSTSRRLIALAACLAALVAGGCGSDDEQEPQGKPIPAAQAQALQDQLDSIQGRYDFGGGACGDISGGADPNTKAVDQILASIPNSVAADVRSALDDSFDRLFQLTDEQCDEKKGQNTDTTPSTPTETETVETTTTETETVPTTPTETETVPTTPEPPVTTPGNGNGNGNGNGQGNGNGNGVGQGGGGGAEVPGGEQ
jgi:hypothetical protein